MAWYSCSMVPAQRDLRFFDGDPHAWQHPQLAWLGEPACVAHLLQLPNVLAQGRQLSVVPLSRVLQLVLQGPHLPLVHTGFHLQP